MVLTTYYDPVASQVSLYAFLHTENQYNQYPSWNLCHHPIITNTHAVSFGLWEVPDQPNTILDFRGHLTRYVITALGLGDSLLGRFRRNLWLKAAIVCTNEYIGGSEIAFLIHPRKR